MTIKKDLLFHLNMHLPLIVLPFTNPFGCYLTSVLVLTNVLGHNFISILGLTNPLAWPYTDIIPCFYQPSQVLHTAIDTNLLDHTLLIAPGFCLSLFCNQSTFAGIWVGWSA